MFALGAFIRVIPCITISMWPLRSHVHGEVLVSGFSLLAHAFVGPVAQMWLVLRLRRNATTFVNYLVPTHVVVRAQCKLEGPSGISVGQAVVR